MYMHFTIKQLRITNKKSIAINAIIALYTDCGSTAFQLQKPKFTDTGAVSNKKRLVKFTRFCSSRQRSLIVFDPPPLSFCLASRPTSPAMWRSNGELVSKRYTQPARGRRSPDGQTGDRPAGTVLGTTR